MRLMKKMNKEMKKWIIMNINIILDLKSLMEQKFKVNI